MYIFFVCCVETEILKESRMHDTEHNIYSMWIAAADEVE